MQHASPIALLSYVPTGVDNGTCIKVSDLYSLYTDIPNSNSAQLLNSYLFARACRILQLLLLFYLEMRPPGVHFPG